MLLQKINQNPRAGIQLLKTLAGLEAAASAFVETLQGRTDPQKGIIIQP